ncbi:MAG: hypothetical protein IT290_06970 [Deltaproteobacteria bacterium]|nr:hypothetical protein [Deltaproteobacteria bacterium]
MEVTRMLTIADTHKDPDLFRKTYGRVVIGVNTRRLPLRVPNEFAIEVTMQFIAAVVAHPFDEPLELKPATADAIATFYQWLLTRKGPTGSVPPIATEDDVVEFLLSEKGPIVLGRN